jgi:DNA-directed RNA polymerase alpha subunit
MDITATALPVKLASPAQRALSGAGITCLQDLTKVQEKEIRDLHGIGPNALRQLKQAMAENGLAFADNKVKP